MNEKRLRAAIKRGIYRHLRTKHDLEDLRDFGGVPAVENLVRSKTEEALALAAKWNLMPGDIVSFAMSNYFDPSLRTCLVEVRV